MKGNWISRMGMCIDLVGGLAGVKGSSGGRALKVVFQGIWLGLCLVAQGMDMERL